MNFLGGLSIKATTAVVVWGASFVATRIALSAITPQALVAIRMVVGAGLLLLLARFVFKTSKPAGDFGRTVMLGLILALHLWMQSVGLLRTTATNTGWIIGFGPITIAIFAWIFLKQPIKGLAWFGILVGALGVALVSFAQGFTLTDAHWGDLLQLTSCLTWAAYTTISVGPISRHGSLSVTAWSTTVAGLAMLPMAAGGITTGQEVTLSVIFAVVFLSVACSGLAFWLWTSAVREIGSMATGTYLYLEPFVTWMAAAWILGERLRPLGLIGGLLVLGGVLLVSRSNRSS